MFYKLDILIPRIFKIQAPVLTNTLTLSFSVRAQLFSWELHCPDHVHGRCCALNKLQRTRHVSITCFKINPAVYRSVGSRLWTQAGARVLCRGPVPCRVPVLHNRCLIREEQGGVHTGYQMKNHRALKSDAGRCCGCRGNKAAYALQITQNLGQNHPNLTNDFSQCSKCILLCFWMYTIQYHHCM